MFQIDTSTAVAVEPAPGPAGTPGYFTDGNPVLGVRSTIVSADWLNAVQDELLAVILASGQAPSKTQRNQLLQALDLIIEAKAGNYAVDTGTADNYVVALSPAITAYTGNFAFQFRAIHANTGNCQVNFGAGFVQLARDDGSAMQQGDITADAVVAGEYDFSLNKALVSSVVPSQFGALAKLNIGGGLVNDGAGNLELKTAGDGSLQLTAAGLRANRPIAHVAANQVIGAAAHFSTFVNTAAAGITLSLAQCSTLWNGFSIFANAQAGAITLAPDASNSITVGAVAGADGASITIRQGASGFVSVDDTGNWLVEIWGTAAAANASAATGWVAAVSGAGTIAPGHMLVAADAYGTVADGGIPNAAPAPTYVNSSEVLGAGRYNIDTSAGPITITIAPGLISDQSVEIFDVSGTFGINPLTISTGAFTVTVPGLGSPIAGPLVVDVSGIDLMLTLFGTTLQVT